MNIAIIGATGYVGSALLQEALARGHKVTALVRHIDKLPKHDHLIAREIDVYDSAAVSSAIKGLDALISAFSPGLSDPALREHHVKGARSIIDGVKRAGVARLLVVGGAGSLEVAPGVQLVDTPQFPEQWKGTALATRDVLGLLENESTLQWTFLSPPAQLEPGTRTGNYQLGEHALLVDAKGNSHISLADYAVAMLDELETPKHVRRRFAVAAK